MELIERVKKWLKSLELTQKEKIEIITIVTLAMLMGTILWIVDHGDFDGTLLRNTFGGGEREEEMVLTMGEILQGENIIINIHEQKYEEEQIAIVKDQVWELVLEEIEKGHDSLEEIVGEINLPTKIKNYPIEINWDWEPREALDRYGVLQEEAVGGKETLVTLKASLIYEDEETIYIQGVKIAPKEKTSEEIWLEAIKENLELKDEANATSEEFDLPEEIDGMKLDWSMTSNKRGLMVAAMGVLIGGLLMLKKKEEQKKKYKEELEEMRNDYPEIIGAFSLYMGAGMTTKNIWKKIVEEYRSSGKNRVAYERMCLTYQEMLNGRSQINAYEEFAYSHPLLCYRKFALLLAQNVKKGTKGITEILEQEVLEAFEERKRRAKTIGEKAGTKLLLPMFLMLSVVLCIVIVPAFLSVQL